MRVALAALMVGFVAASGACSSSGTGTGTYAAKCQAACTPPSGPCASQDVTTCQNNCIAATDGLPVLCAQCITENSGWSGQQCVNNALCSFGPGPTQSCSGSSAGCSASQETCSGFVLAKATGSLCAQACGAGD